MVFCSMYATDRGDMGDGSLSPVENRPVDIWSQQEQSPLTKVSLRTVPFDTFPGPVIDPDSRLDIIEKDMKADALAVVLYGQGFHLYAPGDELLSMKPWRYSVKHPSGGMVQIPCNL